MSNQQSIIKLYYHRLQSFFGGMNPHKQWMVLLRASLVICAILIIGSFSLLLQIKNEQIFQIKKTTIGAANVDQSLLTTVNAMLQARTQAQNDIQQSPAVGDPSF